jgi:hypothetical protein
MDKVRSNQVNGLVSIMDKRIAITETTEEEDIVDLAVSAFSHNKLSIYLRLYLL